MSGSDDVELSVNEVTVGYGQADVLHAVTLQLLRGHVTALMGANGAGKSSLLKAIMGLIPLTSGDIRLRDRSITGKSTTEISALGVALVPEGRGIFASQTLESNLLAAGWAVRSDRKRLRANVAEMYARFPLLARRRSSRAGTLSGGESRILSIAMALMTGPSVLLLDEPSLGLAPLVIDSVLDVIDGLKNEGKTILLVEQNAQVALEVSGDGHLLHLGHIVASGSPETLAQHEDLQEAYLGPRG
jgi:branched-chain amino acid transport system ATP-binding protein